jgi:hypothetical protein
MKSLDLLLSILCKPLTIHLLILILQTFTVKEKTQSKTWKWPGKTTWTAHCKTYLQEPKQCRALLDPSTWCLPASRRPDRTQGQSRQSAAGTNIFSICHLSPLFEPRPNIFAFWGYWNAHTHSSGRQELIEKKWNQIQPSFLCAQQVSLLGGKWRERAITCYDMW